MIDAATDARWMARCLELAGQGGRTSPNPQVGCVIVSARGKVLAEGWHRGPSLANPPDDRILGEVERLAISSLEYHSERRLRSAALL